MKILFFSTRFAICLHILNSLWITLKEHIKIKKGLDTLYHLCRTTRILCFVHMKIQDVKAALGVSVAVATGEEALQCESEGSAANHHLPPLHAADSLALLSVEPLVHFDPAKARLPRHCLPLSPADYPAPFFQAPPPLLLFLSPLLWLCAQ